MQRMLAGTLSHIDEQSTKIIREKYLIKPTIKS